MNISPCVHYISINLNFSWVRDTKGILKSKSQCAKMIAILVVYKTLVFNYRDNLYISLRIKDTLYKMRNINDQHTNEKDN